MHCYRVGSPWVYMTRNHLLHYDAFPQPVQLYATYPVALSRRCSIVSALLHDTSSIYGDSLWALVYTHTNHPHSSVPSGTQPLTSHLQQLHRSHK